MGRKGSSDLDKLRAQVRAEHRKPWAETLAKNAEVCANCFMWFCDRAKPRLPCRRTTQGQCEP